MVMADKPRREHMRVEPKTLFANERTFIQWLSVGVILLGFGIALLEAEVHQEENSHDEIAAGALLIIALSIGIFLYGLGMYLTRLEKLKTKRSGTMGFENRTGPIVLVVLITTCTVVFTSVVYATRPSAQRAASATLGDGSIATTFAKEFQVELHPAAYGSREALAAAVYDALASSPHVTELKVVNPSYLSPDVTVFQRARLDTSTTRAERKFQRASTSLRVRRSSRFDNSSGRLTQTLRRTVITLKTNGDDEEFLVATSSFLRCTPLFAAHCKLKIEQDTYTSGYSKYASTLSFGGLPNDFSISSVADLVKMVGPLDELNRALLTKRGDPVIDNKRGTPLIPVPLAEDDPLLLRSYNWQYRLRIPFKLAGLQMEAQIDLYYTTMIQLAMSEMQPAPPKEGELSFRINAAKGTRAFPSEAVVAAYDLLLNTLKGSSFDAARLSTTDTGSGAVV